MQISALLGSAMSKSVPTFVLALSLALAVCAAADPVPSPGLAPLRADLRALESLHERALPPRRGEWRDVHREPGQTFEQYVGGGSAIFPTMARSTLVVQPLGTFSGANERIVRTVALALEAHFGLRTRLAQPIALDIPPEARRGSRGFGEQALTKHLLAALEQRLPDDAMAYVAFTEMDLFPEASWNFVFGQASLQQRVGVWSLARNGDPSSDDLGYRRALLRAVKTATHEVGHMFGMHHCTAYRCNMAGVNSLEEGDRSPSWLCPECLAKVSWVTATRAEDHLRRMQVFVSDLDGLGHESDHYAKSLEALADRSASTTSAME